MSHPSPEVLKNGAVDRLRRNSLCKKNTVGYGFLVVFGAGFMALPFIAEPFIAGAFVAVAFIAAGLAVDFIAWAVALGMGLALGAAAIAGAVIRNAATAIDAIIFFMCTPPSVVTYGNAWPVKATNGKPLRE
jgi:hypothetical protein